MSGRWLLLCRSHRLAVWSCWKHCKRKWTCWPKDKGIHRSTLCIPVMLEQKCTSGTQAVVSETANVSPMGQGSQRSCGMHDESFVLRAMATGTQPVNTCVISLAAQVNSGIREPEIRNHNMVNMSSMGQGSQMSHEIHDGSLAVREVAKGTQQPVNTGVVNLAAQVNSGIREPESRNCNIGSMGHGSQM